jgi:hypothetical protein
LIARHRVWFRFSAAKRVSRWFSFRDAPVPIHASFWSIFLGFDVA